MKKKVCTILIVLVVAAAFPAVADIQVDIGVNVPFLFGVEFADEDAQQWSEYAFVLPDAKVSYFMEFGNLKLGAGLRAFTIILESLVYPTVTAEYDISDVRLSASIGGGAFALIGLYNDIFTGNIWMPEVSAIYRVNEWFGLGVGATGFFIPGEEELVENPFPYAAYALARFTLGGKE